MPVFKLNPATHAARLATTALLAAFLSSPACADPIAAPAPAQLTADWWQWAMSTSEEDSPVADPTGANCGVNQRGNTWFLAGGFGSSKIQRTCTVPSATDGFWLLLNPLPPGRHTLKFGGRYNHESTDYGRMVQDIEYVLNVQ